MTVSEKYHLEVLVLYIPDANWVALPKEIPCEFEDHEIDMVPDVVILIIAPLIVCAGIVTVPAP